MTYLHAMTTKFNLDLILEIEPVWHESLPRITVLFDQEQLFHGEISQIQRINLRRDVLPGQHCISLLFDNKTDLDTDIEQKLDKAVIVKQITLNGITDPKFVWAGVYYPRYPELWLGQQSIVPPATLNNQTYLGWNGTWRLDFTAPVFSWIHQLQSLGWVYD